MTGPDVFPADGINPDSPFIHSTEFWQTLSDGRVQCDVCPRACKLREGQRGLCGCGCGYVCACVLGWLGGWDRGTGWMGATGWNGGIGWIGGRGG